MCTGRVDLAFILRAFSNGADGVYIGGCWLGECRYITDGNYDALSLTHLCRKILAHAGVAPERLRIEWTSASEGVRFADIMNDFGRRLKQLGPLGTGEGLHGLRFKLAAATNLIPYIKLVERERLRVRFDSEAEYDAFFGSEEVARLFGELIVDKLALSQIMALLREQPASAGDICGVLALSPSDMARHLKSLARMGLVTFDETRNLIAAAALGVDAPGAPDGALQAQGRFCSA
jgi:F420-non-reducing hydrogenase iron-sulfur subunit